MMNWKGCGMKDYVKINVKGTVCEDMAWTVWAQDTLLLWAAVNMVMNHLSDC
jgi:hypothetical protein